MVGLGIEVAKGFLSLDSLREMIRDPNFKLPEDLTHVLRRAPPEGLAYVGGEYHPALLEGETDDIRKLPVGPVPSRDNWRPTIPWHDKEVDERVMALTDPDVDNISIPTRVNECIEILQRSPVAAEE